MQVAFRFAADDLASWHARLLAAYGDPLPIGRRTPLGQLVKSIISSRTRDAVSTAAHDALAARWPRLLDIADADPGEVRALIAAVTHPDDKVGYLLAALRLVRVQRPDGDLDFLGRLPLGDALAWLERLPGVARKVAAMTLNGSTLDRPVFIADSHVRRVLVRLRFLPESATFRKASEAVTAAAPGWSGHDLLRFHIWTKRLGQEVCHWDHADCGLCPLHHLCPTGASARP